MKLRFHHSARRRQASLSTEMSVALAVLAMTAIPLSFSFLLEAKMVKTSYHDAVAMEIVDGEMEILAAGAWTSQPVGEHSYTVNAEAARNLPPGHFLLTRTTETLRLEWRPEKAGEGHPQRREVRLP